MYALLHNYYTLAHACCQGISAKTNLLMGRLPQLGAEAARVQQAMQDKLIEHYHYVRLHGEDLPEIQNWKWVA